MFDGGTSPDYVVMLTAIPVEYLAVREHLTDIDEETLPIGIVCERGTFSHKRKLWNVVIVEVGAGNADTALAAERAITYFKPILILFVGVAGGLKNVSIGDVVAATKVYGYASGKAKTHFETRPDVGNSTYRMEQRAKAEARKLDWLQRIKGSIPEHPPKVLVAPIASGDQVIASTDSDVCKFLQDNYGDAVAVEMEGHGFLHATRAYPQVDALIIRGISDLIDGKNDADANNLQAVAARHASAFAFEVLAKLSITELQKSHQRQEAEAPVTFTEKREVDELKEDETTSTEPSETTSLEAITDSKLDEFHTAVVEYHAKIKKIYDLFDEGKDIFPDRCKSAIKLLDIVDEHVQRLRQELLDLNMFDKVQLVNIHEQISELKSELQWFRSHRRLLVISSREYKSRYKRAHNVCQSVLSSLNQFHTAS